MNASDGVLAQLIAAAEDGLAAFDRELRYVAWNPVMQRIFGLSAEHVLGKRAPDLFPFLVETGEDARLRDALAGKASRSSDRPFRVEASGRSGYYSARYAPWTSGSGEILGGIAVLRDITEEKRAREEMAETETRFQNMADASPVMLWMSGTDGLCTFFNQTWLKFTGRTLEEEWGVGWAEGVHFEDFQRAMDIYLVSFCAREVFEMEYRLKRKDGEYRWILDRGSPRYSPDGSFAGYIGSCVDITDRKLMETDLMRSVRSRDEFLSIASHELRTPLTTLSLHMETLVRRLAKEVDANSRAQNNAAKAMEQVHHLTQMVNVLLDISRISEGRLALELDLVELGELVREVAARLSQNAQDAGCALSVSIEGEVVGRFDRFRVSQIITNLLANAIKYGAGTPVSISLSRDGDGARLVVTDRGPGVAAEQQQLIFERFVRLAPARQYGGFGLGLWIARELVQAHGGRIGVESRPGQGASFFVELPLAAHAEKTQEGASG